jgi:hypothetical protein
MVPEECVTLYITEVQKKNVAEVLEALADIFPEALWGDGGQLPSPGKFDTEYGYLELQRFGGYLRLYYGAVDIDDDPLWPEGADAPGFRVRTASQFLTEGLFETFNDG